MPPYNVVGRKAPVWLVTVSLALASGCSGSQSTLEPAGYHAQQIATLWWWMMAGAIVVWLIMIALTYYAIFAKRGRHYQRLTASVVIGGGVVFPMTILSVLLYFGLSMLPKLLARPPAGSMVIDVEGIQWWWRVRYDGINLGQLRDRSFETANEICIPVDQPVEFRLRSHDVIHSFWIPALAGKVDMLPGRVTRLTVHPYRTGRFRGACAEYCGDSHAWMNFDVRIMEQNEFEKWLIHQVSDAVVPDVNTAERGERVFRQSGCGACHTVRGTTNSGTVGPELTHFGSRLSLGAGRQEMSHEAVVSWLRSTEQLKPGVHMPSFAALGESQLDDLAAYLEQLK